MLEIFPEDTVLEKCSELQPALHSLHRRDSQGEIVKALEISLAGEEAYASTMPTYQEGGRVLKA